MTTDLTMIARWYSGKALKVIEGFVLPTLAVAEEQGYWPKGASRKVWAALNKQNVAIKWARANEKAIEEIRVVDSVRGVCSNCGQFQHAHGKKNADCLNECVKRGLATVAAGLDASDLPYRKSAWLIGHAMRFGLVAEAPSVVDIALNLASNLKLGATDQNETNRALLKHGLAWAMDFKPVAELLAHLDAARPKPVYVFKTLSRTVANNLGKSMGIALDSIESPPMKGEWVTMTDDKGKKYRAWVVTILWPEGTRHYQSKFAYGSKAGNEQCHACGHAIKDPWNWAPLLGHAQLPDIDRGDFPVSLWVGKDCARKLFNVDVTGDAVYANRTEGKS